MAIPTTIESLSTTAASNGPAGTEQRTLADDGLRQAYAFIRQVVSQGSDITSGTTITPPSTGYQFDVTGTTTITTIDSTYSWNGRLIALQFDGALTLTHSSNLYLPGAANITTVAGDVALFAQRGTGSWQCIAYSNKANILRVGGAAITNSAGNWTIPAPSSGTAVAITALSSNYGLTITDGTITSFYGLMSSGSEYSGTFSNHGTIFRTNNTDRITIAAAGNVTVNAPSSGLTANFTGIANISIVGINDGTRTIGIGTDSANNTGFIGTTSAHGFDLYAGGSQRVRLGSAGNVTINAPSSGTALTVNTLSGSSGLILQDGTVTQRYLTSGGQSYGGNFSNHPFSIRTNDLDRITIAAAGNVTINAPDSGLSLVVDGQVGGAAAINDVAKLYTGSSSTATSRLLFGSLANAESGAIGVHTTASNTGEMIFYTDRAGTLTEFMRGSSAGNVTIAAPASGYGLNIPTGTPASAGATGTAGDIAWDSSYIYVCTATNTWKRAALSTW